MLTRACLSLFLFAGSSLAAEIILPAPALERDGVVPVTYRTRSQATGRGQLAIRWTDAHGRVVDDRTLAIELTDETDIIFHLDLRRAAAMKNDLIAHLTLDGVDKKGAPDRRDEKASASFIARPPDHAWWDYIILMWQQHSKEMFATLKSLGINAGQYNGKNKTPPEFLLSNDLRWYAENIATDYYAEYHRWRPDRIQNWSFLQARELYKKDPTSKEAFKRHPSFSDPAWRAMIRERLVESARNHSPYRPVFYSLGDESGIADLAAYWDFDFSDHALAEMREWLQQRYATLADLNRQWGASFTRWEHVTPDTTDEAMRRKDENYSSWADHKEFMDISFANALKMGADAIRSVDPKAYVGIGGAQMPGWGGYDYYRLTQALTALEPYDIGNNIEIIRSLNPDVAVVTTAFARGPWEKHRVWYELLHGARGQLIWDEKVDIVTKQNIVGERGEEVKPYYTELRNGIATLLMASRREADPIAIHYSQASMRTEWMKAQQPKGRAWVDRGSATERRDSEFLRLRESWCRVIEDTGRQYNFVAYGQIEDGELLKRGYRVLVLPRSSALSEREAEAIRAFVRQGGTLLLDGEAGTFDEHSRRLPQPRLQDLFTNYGKGRVWRVASSLLNYHQDRLVGKQGAAQAIVSDLLKEAGVEPPFAVTNAQGRPVVGVETHRFRNGGVTLVALHRNPQLRVDELGPPEFKSNERFEKPQPVRLTLPAAMHVYDIRSGRAMGLIKQAELSVEPYEPVILACSPEELPVLQATAPASIGRGESGQIGVSFSGITPAAQHVVRVDVVDPAGAVVPHYSGNVPAERGRGGKLLPLARNDATGEWEIRVRDVLSGQEASSRVTVR
jgi:hypothetical protein